MIYLRCPTCGEILGNRQIEYDNNLTQIQNNPNLSSDDKLKLKTELINSLQLKRYCCKMRVISSKELTEIIK